MTLAERVHAIEWYHSIELPGGVVTPGWFDTRKALDRVPLPRSLAGRRCLDVGTWDGFWAFEMERRGAASVTAIDLDDPERWDWPAPARGGSEVEVLRAVKGGNEGFAIAREALRSRVERVDRSVYEAEGEYDFVFLGSLLLHLRDPVGALERLRDVCTGELLVADAVELLPSLIWRRTPVARLEGVERPWWWQPNRAALLRMVESAGFRPVRATRVYFVPTGPAHPPTRLRLGVPHVAVLAR